MRKIDKPVADFSDVFDACTRTIRNDNFSKRLREIEPALNRCARDYNEKSEAAEWYLIDQYTHIEDTISKAEFGKLYTLKLSKLNASGRSYYDQIRSSSQGNICPLCGQREVSTLDHYLPKANYPVFSILPNNLVPACKDCNFNKGTELPLNAHQQMLHPYYDEIDQVRWLTATIVEDDPASFIFSIHPSDEMDELLLNRITHHFRTLKLGRLYSSQAATELCNVRYYLECIENSVGTDGVIEHLEVGALSREKSHKNSWQTAMYYAMVENEWFYSGGYNHV